MDINKIKIVCKDIISICNDIEMTNQKAEVSDLFMHLENKKDELDKIIN